MIFFRTFLCVFGCFFIGYGMCLGFFLVGFFFFLGRFCVVGFLVCMSKTAADTHPVREQSSSMNNWSKLRSCIIQ